MRSRAPWQQVQHLLTRDPHHAITGPRPRPLTGAQGTAHAFSLRQPSQGLFLSCRRRHCTTRGLPSLRGARTVAGRWASPHSFSVGPSPASAKPVHITLYLVHPVRGGTSLSLFFFIFFSFFSLLASEGLGVLGKPSASSDKDISILPGNSSVLLPHLNATCNCQLQIGTYQEHCQRPKNKHVCHLHLRRLNPMLP